MPITSAITRRSQRHRNRQRHCRHSLSRKRSYAHTRRTRRWAKRKVCRRGGMPGVSQKTDLHNIQKMTETNQIRWAADDNKFYCTQPKSQDGYIPCIDSEYNIISRIQLYLHTEDINGIINFLNSDSFSTGPGSIGNVNVENSRTTEQLDTIKRNNWLMIKNDPDRLIKKNPFGQTMHFFQRNFEDTTYNCYFGLSISKTPSFYCLMLKDGVTFITLKQIPTRNTRNTREARKLYI